MEFNFLPGSLMVACADPPLEIVASRCDKLRQMQIVCTFKKRQDDDSVGR